MPDGGSLESNGGRRGSVELPGLGAPAGSDSKPRFTREGEQSVVAVLLGSPKRIPEVIGSGVEPEHFFDGAMRALFGEIVQRFYADEHIDPLVVAEHCAKTLSRSWNSTEEHAVAAVERLVSQHRSKPVNVGEHARLVKRYSDYRALIDLSNQIVLDVERELEEPGEIAGVISQTAMQIATSGLLSQDIVTYEDLGRNFVREQRRLMAARAAGIELGVYFDLSFIDSFTRGLRPSELMFIAGEPGAGKSAVIWTGAQLFAEKQMKKPADKRMGTLVLSLEMAEEPSSTRLAQKIARLDGGKLREGRTDEADLQAVIKAWAARRDLPLYFNFASNMKGSQLKALVIEAIRRHNVGLVIIDHFKYLDMDGRWRSELEQEEAKARFLKQDIATQLNVAVACLAHTTKGIENSDDRRPRLSHLRGSGQVAAHADFVGFVYRPYSHAKQDDIDEGRVKRTDAEMIWAKNRHALEGTARFFFDAATMTIY